MKKEISITAVLNLYRRNESLSKQLEALEAQTVIPNEVIIWTNDNNMNLAIEKCKFDIITIRCSRNVGVWGRFSGALNATSEFILVLDDDTIPGKQWIESCIELYQKVPSVLGTNGVKFRTKYCYFPFVNVGWRNPNESAAEVDIVGHAWFFHRDLLRVFWMDAPFADRHPILSGEDLHLSYVAQIFKGIPTIVPPHPIDNMNLWGSIRGLELGEDRVALSMNAGAAKRMNRSYQYYIKRGFRIQRQAQIFQVLGQIRDLFLGYSFLIRTITKERLKSFIYGAE